MTTKNIKADFASGIPTLEGVDTGSLRTKCYALDRKGRTLRLQWANDGSAKRKVDISIWDDMENRHAADTVVRFDRQVLRLDATKSRQSIRLVMNGTQESFRVESAKLNVTADVELILSAPLTARHKAAATASADSYKARKRDVQNTASAPAKATVKARK